MKKGFTLVEIMIVVAIIGLLAAIAIPSFMRARTTSQKNACINNLRQIEAAKDQYALENGLTNLAAISTNDTTTFTDFVTGDGDGGYIKTWPTCPSTNATKNAAGAAACYSVNAVGSNAACNIVTAHVLP